MSSEEIFIRIKIMLKKLTVFLFFLFTLFAYAKSAYAVSFDLIAPTGQLTRGGNAQFTINVDSEGASITSTQVGIFFDTQFLQYISTVPGDAMTSVAASQTDTGKYLLTGANSAGFKGKGTFAVVTFKIIATAPGSTQLCALWGPSSSPAPTGSPAPTSPPGNTTPIPTQLPKTGGSNQIPFFALMVVILFGISAGSLLLIRKDKYTKIPHKKK